MFYYFMLMKFGRFYKKDVDQEQMLHFYISVLTFTS